MYGYLFDEINVNRIQAFAMTENKKSAAVLLRNSFLKEVVIRKGYYWTGHGIIDLELYAILYNDYLKSFIVLNTLQYNRKAEQ